MNRCPTAVARQLEQSIRNRLRRLRAGEGAHGCAHLGALVRIAAKLEDRICQILCPRGRLIEELRRAFAGKTRGVLALAIVGGGGQGNQDRGLSCDSQLRQGQGSRARPTSAVV